jgi:hypothetical protein
LPRIRGKVSGRTKTVVRDKLRELRRELDNGLHKAIQQSRISTR